MMKERKRKRERRLRRREALSKCSGVLQQFGLDCLQPV
jgi:hypothetical protein